jgi:acetoacetyl-CoA synthetase
MSDPTPLWQPTAAQIADSQLAQFMHAMAAKHGFASEWEALRRWSIDDAPTFWSELLSLTKVKLHHPAEALCTGNDMLGTRWFPGLTLNYAEHLLCHTGDTPAIRFDSETGQHTTWTWDALRAAVSQAAGALRATGIQPGDRVAGYLPNIPETVIAMLATASLGAVWSSCSPDFGTRAVLDRFGQISPRVLITVDGYSYGGKPFDLGDRVAEIAAAIVSLKQVVVISYANTSLSPANVPGGVAWDEWLATASADAALTFQPVPFDHPLFIMYSSGTTGVPKCIVHGHGGTLLQQLKEHILHGDLRAGERIFYFTTCGWMMWNWLVAALGVGATIVLYEGNPAYPTIHRLWEIADQLRINVFGTSPKFLAACQKAGIKPGAEHDLGAMRMLCSTGAPLSGDLFTWVYAQVKPDLLLASISGGTDIISCFMLGNPMLPVYAGEIQCRGLGMDVQTWDAKGDPITGEPGELVCCRPFPSQPVGFWNDDDRQKYRAAYFEHFAGHEVWRHGDLVEITPRGGLIVHGRSDATLNPGGVRIGTAEIYRIVESLPEVLDSIAVGKRTGDDVEVALFVALRPGLTLDNELRKRIRTALAANASKRHVPRHIRQVPEIPHTISGKKTELAVQQRLHGEPVRNRDALANPSALDAFEPFD